MPNFVTAAARPVRNVKQFLRDSADNNIKYTPERNARHQLYIPYMVAMGEDGKEVKDLVARSIGVHDIIPAPGKFEATICLDGLVMEDDSKLDADGNPVLLTDGTCPFCERVASAWSIRNYLKKKEEERCGKTGDELTEYMKSVDQRLRQERKVKEKKMYIYLLVVKFKLASDGKTPVLGTDGLPDYELKVAKWSASRVQKIQEVFDNSEIEFEGGEIVFKYPDVDSAMQLASQNTASPLFGPAKFTEKYPGLKAKIDADVSKWTWDDLAKSFREWNGYTVKDAKKKCDELFRAWDKYEADLNTPNAHEYLEDSCVGPEVTNPAIGTAQVNAPTAIGVEIPAVGAGIGTGLGGMATNIPDPNAVFSGLGGAPSID